LRGNCSQGLAAQARDCFIDSAAGFGDCGCHHRTEGFSEFDRGGADGEELGGARSGAVEFEGEGKEFGRAEVVGSEG
jgi:hypothetical protein